MVPLPKNSTINRCLTVEDFSRSHTRKGRFVCGGLTNPVYRRFGGP